MVSENLGGNAFGGEDRSSKLGLFGGAEGGDFYELRIGGGAEGEDIVLWIAWV